MENVIVALLPRRRHSVLVRYSVSLAIVGVVFLLRVALASQMKNYPLLLFIPAVFLVALLFDKGSGYFATVVSALLAAYFFIAPRNSLALGPTDYLPLALYVAIGVGISSVVEALRRTMQRLERARSQTALLLEEMGHRTRNDLMMISSVLSLQARGQQDAKVRAALESAVSRVAVIASAQERLHVTRADHQGRVELSGFLTALCTGLGNLLRDVRPIAVRVEAAPVELPPSRAVAVGLIVNELVTNAFKYAFPDGAGGAVVVSLQPAGKRLHIVVTDDGIGCPVDPNGGTGSRLVRLLASDLGGEMERMPVDTGCKVRVTIPMQVATG